MRGRAFRTRRAEASSEPSTTVDADGEPLTGDRQYRLRFEPGALPPVSVLWNLSMYDAGEFFIPNDFGRYSIGSTTDGVTHDDDGGLTLLIKAEQPDDTANWLGRRCAEGSPWRSPMGSIAP